MGIEYRTAQLEFREILSKLQPVFVSAFMLWLDNKVAEYKMFGDVQLKDFEDEDVWYSFPAWCEEQLYTLSNPTVQSTSRSTVSWQRLRQQHRQRLSCLSGEQCRPAKKRKLHVNYDSEGNNFPVIVNVTSNNEIYENVAVPGATDAERQSEVPVPQETLVVRRSDDTPDIDSESGLFTNTGTVIQSETDHGNGQDDEIPIEIHRKQSSVAANAESDSRSEGVVEKESVVIKIEPGDYSNSPCDKLIDSNVSHVISPVSGYSSSSNPYHEKLDISSSQKDQSRTSTENIVNSVLLQNRAGPSGASVSQHLQIPTVTQFSPSVISDQVMDEDSRGLKKEPVDDDYMSAGGSGGDYSVFEDSLAADSVTENSSMYLDPDIISNVSNQPEQGGKFSLDSKRQSAEFLEANASIQKWEDTGQKQQASKNTDEKSDASQFDFATAGIDASVPVSIIETDTGNTYTLDKSVVNWVHTSSVRSSIDTRPENVDNSITNDVEKMSEQNVRSIGVNTDENYQDVEDRFKKMKLQLIHISTLLQTVVDGCQTIPAKTSPPPPPVITSVINTISEPPKLPVGNEKFWDLPVKEVLGRSGSDLCELIDTLSAAPSVTDLGEFNIDESIIEIAKTEGRGTRKSFAVSLFRQVCSIKDVYEKNVTGAQRKQKINPVKILCIQDAAFKNYPIASSSDQAAEWKKIVKAIDHARAYIENRMGRMFDMKN